jgi:hypothetical protein
MSRTKTHEARFSGKDNAGLRKVIREQVAAWVDGRRSDASAEAAVLALRRVVAFTASGLSTLEAVAKDYGRTARTAESRS